VPEAGGRPLRVLMLIDNLAGPGGGAERFAPALARELAGRGVHVEMCATRGAKPAVEEALASAGVPLIALDRRGTLDLIPFGRLVSVMRRKKFDVLHAHLFGSSLWGVLLARLGGVPVVIAQEHGTFPSGRLRQFLYGRVVGRLATRYVAVSTFTREEMVKRYRVRRSRTVVIPAAYIPREDRNACDLRCELGIPSSAKVIGTIATLRPVKALDVLVAAHAQVVERRPDTHLLLTGKGPSRTDLERQVQLLGTPERVHFLGHREQIGSVLRALDLGVLSSDSEGTPIFVMECMAYGVPVVSTDVGGLRDLVEPDVSGVLVPPRDPSSMAAAIAELLDDPDRGERLAAASSARLTDLTLAAVAARFVRLYASLATEPRTPSRFPGRRGTSGQSAPES
jgi:glycosyltransferase involved in cell wall biosynthesis